MSNGQPIPKLGPLKVMDFIIILNLQDQNLEKPAYIVDIQAF